MGFINDIAPSPADTAERRLEDGGTLTISEDAPTSIFIYKTISEPQIGMVSYFKVYAGKVKGGDELINADNRTSERINSVYVAEGKTRTQVDELVAGDLGVTVKLKNSHTNQTLNTKGTNLQIRKT